jgi:hypothetical protein
MYSILSVFPEAIDDFSETLTNDDENAFDSIAENTKIDATIAIMCFILPT